MYKDELNKFQYKKFDAKAAVRYFDYFSMRPNRSNNSGPIDCLIWSDILETQYCILDDCCLVTLDRDGDTHAGCVPYCEENNLSHYFKLQEEYFNDVLREPFRAYLQDCEGVEFLKSQGLLDDYEIIESNEIFDYIYSAEEHRKLAGGKYECIRKPINKFNRMYTGRWEYRSLGYNNRKEIQEFLQLWKDNKLPAEGDANYGKDVSASETLDVEIQGAMQILDNSSLMVRIKAGGIYVDGKLCAFEMGSYNPRERMYISEITAARRDVKCLFPKMEHEFLVHEFPHAELINSADDVGLVNLRNTKMSKKPIAFEKRYTLVQNYNT